MKYEYLCGYESDFFTMPANVIAVVQLDHCVQGLTEFSQITECGKPVIAMRRFIPEPERWTVEDKKAGQLPDVGCLVTTYDHKQYVFVGESCHNDQWSLRDVESGKVYHTPISWVLPIETPEEKAARLREEWCVAASKLLKNLEYSSTLTSIYDALLSGELPVPGMEE